MNKAIVDRIQINMEIVCLAGTLMTNTIVY